MFIFGKNGLISHFFFVKTYWKDYVTFKMFNYLTFNKEASLSAVVYISKFCCDNVGPSITLIIISDVIIQTYIKACKLNIVLPY